MMPPCDPHVRVLQGKIPQGARLSKEVTDVELLTSRHETKLKRLSFWAFARLKLGRGPYSRGTRPFKPKYRLAFSDYGRRMLTTEGRGAAKREWMTMS